MHCLDHLLSETIKRLIGPVVGEMRWEYRLGEIGITFLTALLLNTLALFPCYDFQADETHSNFRYLSYFACSSNQSLLILAIKYNISRRFIQV